MPASNSPQFTQITIKSSEENFTPMEIFLKYFSYLPLFILSLVACFAIAIAMIRYTTPIYSSSTRLFIRNDNDNKVGGSSRGTQGNGDLIESALFSNKQVNIENEIALISTFPLIKKVVLDHQFNYYYYDEGRIRKTEFFKNAPFEVDAIQWADSTSYFGFQVSNISADGGNILINNSKIQSPFKWNEYLNVNGNRFRLIRNSMYPSKGVFSFKVKPAEETAYEFLGGLSIVPYSAKTTIIKLELRSPTLAKASAFLDNLIQEYEIQNIEDKNRVLNNTIQFIGQRLEMVTKELGVVENGMKDFKQDNQLVDIKVQSDQTLLQKGAAEQQLIQLGIQEQLFQSLYNQVTAMKQPQLIPSNLGSGPGSSGLNALIEQYNLLELRKEREEPYLAKNSTVLADLKAQLNTAFQAVVSALTEYGKNLQIEKKALDTKMHEFKGIVGEVPNQEKTFLEIKRQQNVKEGLYLYLLQKREESAISSSSTVSTYKQLEPASGSSRPLEPNQNKYYTIAAIVGLLIPLAFIYLIGLFDDKVKSRSDITKKTSIPIIAEVGHVADMENAFIVSDKSRSVIAEQFRVLRTNLNFMVQDRSVILVTSSMSNEGKSVISLNLAAVLAISNKKVALLEFDLRKPRILHNIGLETNKMGLSNYLAKQTDNLKTLYNIQEGYPSLHIYGCGPIPPNPAELMLGDRMEQLFRELRNQYDYVIIDSAPVGLISDSFAIMKFVDSCLYVIRQRKSLKKQLSFADDLYKNGQLKNVGLVLNDVKVGGRYGYYGHNYGYGYGYNNYAKTYGNYFDQAKKKSLFSKLFRNGK